MEGEVPKRCTTRGWFIHASSVDATSTPDANTCTRSIVRRSLDSLCATRRCISNCRSLGSLVIDASLQHHDSPCLTDSLLHRHPLTPPPSTIELRQSGDDVQTAFRFESRDLSHERSKSFDVLRSRTKIRATYDCPRTNSKLVEPHCRERLNPTFRLGDVLQEVIHGIPEERGNVVLPVGEVGLGVYRHVVVSGLQDVVVMKVSVYEPVGSLDRKSTRLNSSHLGI